jgi:AhpD family alkylhydroperoxidase
MRRLIYSYVRIYVITAKERIMIDNWTETTQILSNHLRDMRAGAGVADVMKTFGVMAQTASKAGAIDAKTKELIALAIGVAVRCDDCLAFHVKAAVKLGATAEEIQETLAMAIYMGAGPSAMYASHAWQAYTQFAGENIPA